MVFAWRLIAKPPVSSRQPDHDSSPIVPMSHRATSAPEPREPRRVPTGCEKLATHLPMPTSKGRMRHALRKTLAAISGSLCPNIGAVWTLERPLTCPTTCPKNTTPCPDNAASGTKDVGISVRSIRSQRPTWKASLVTSTPRSEPHRLLTVRDKPSLHTNYHSTMGQLLQNKNYNYVSIRKHMTTMSS